MIVKDEEKMLLQNLPSIAKVAEELVIVDTGSTDKTKEIAATFTEHVYEFAWTKNFATARNFAASKAKGEWILALDADEYIDTDNFLSSVELLRNANKYHAYIVNITNFSDQSGNHSVVNQMVRVYRNQSGIKYERALHEQLVQIKNGKHVELPLGELPLQIYHYGYLPHIMLEKSKLERNAEILEHGTDIDREDGFYFYNKAQHYIRESNYELALEYLLKAQSRVKKNELSGWSMTCMVMIIGCFTLLKRYKEALTVIADAELLYSRIPDFPISKARIYRQQGRLEDAKEILHTVLNNKQSYDAPVRISGSKDAVPNEMLGDIYEKEKDYQNAIKHYLYGVSTSYTYSLLKKIVSLLLKGHTEKEVFTFLNEKELIKIDEFVLTLIKETLNEGYGELAELLTELLENKDQELLEFVRTKRKILRLEKQFENLTAIIPRAELQRAIDADFIDAGDICLLYFMTNDQEIKPFFDEVWDSMKKDKEIYLTILEKAIGLGKGPYVEFLLTLNDDDTSMAPKVADLFYKYGYKDIALNFYEGIAEKDVTKLGYENIIEFLLETNNIEEAIRIAQLAKDLFEDNFIFFKYLIENTEDNSDLIDQATEKYSDSTWLQQQSFLMDFF